jgi:hypothetical protein
MNRIYKILIASHNTKATKAVAFASKFGFT